MLYYNNQIRVHHGKVINMIFNDKLIIYFFFCCRKCKVFRVCSNGVGSDKTAKSSVSQFIKTLKYFPFIYNPSLRYFKNPLKKNAAWDKIAEVCNMERQYFFLY